jgi:hypothetical protein
MWYREAHERNATVWLTRSLSESAAEVRHGDLTVSISFGSIRTYIGAVIVLMNGSRKCGHVQWSRRFVVGVLYPSKSRGSHMYRNRMVFGAARRFAGMTVRSFRLVPHTFLWACLFSGINFDSAV